MYDCLLVTTEGIKRCHTIPAVSEEIKQTVNGALELVVVDRLESAKVEMLTQDGDVIRLEVIRSRRGKEVH